MKLSCPGEVQVDVTWLEHDDVDAPVLVIWPAFGAPARFYRHLTPSLRNAGMSSVVVEYPDRDLPQALGRHTHYGYDVLATDVHRIVMQEVRRKHPSSQVVLLGHSLGGHVSLFAAALSRAQDDAQACPDAVILAASASPYWKGYGWRGFVRSFVGTACMSAVARVVGYWPGDVLKFWGRQSRVLIADWSRIARTGKVVPAGTQHDYRKALNEYDGAVLAISLPDDALAPVAAVEELLKLVPRAEVTRWHSPVRLGHIQWVRRHDTIVNVIVEWLAERAETNPTRH